MLKDKPMFTEKELKALEKVKAQYLKDERDGLNKKVAKLD